MSMFVLVPGAGSDSWYWHRVVPRLEAAGHAVVAVDLPVDDDTAGLAEYTQAVVDAIRDRGGHERDDVVLVAQSMGGFTAPLVCDHVPVALLVLVAAMAPAPGESPGEWWTNTGHAAARRAAAEADGTWSAEDDDPFTVFLHDVPPEVAAASADHGRDQSATPFATPWPRDGWPDVPTRFLLCRDDRFFPAPFQRRLARERLGIEADEMPGGHLPALAQPDELVTWLERYRAAAGL